MTGVDFSEVALDLAARAAPDVDWVLADLRDYEPEQAAFDLVLVLYVHLPPPSGARSSRAPPRRSRRAGQLLVVGHDVTNIGTGAPGPSNPERALHAGRVARELAASRP